LTAETKEAPKKATKKAVKEEPEAVVDPLEEQIAVLEAVHKAVDRTLVHPETQEERTFVQHEMGFMTKLKFFRLLSGTLRLASEQQYGGIMGVVEATMTGDQSSTEFLETIMRLIELVPDFAEQTYIYALNIKPKDQEWALQAFDSLGDEEGIDILDTFIAQNGEAIRDFFVKHLKKIGQRVSQMELTKGLAQESGDTT
jgi:hypothetical protein